MDVIHEEGAIISEAGRGFTEERENWAPSGTFVANGTCKGERLSRTWRVGEAPLNNWKLM
jgi:hypothetical protein